MMTPLRRVRNGAASLAVIFILSVLGYRFIGNYSWSESVWMVVITVSTVGYGERSGLPVPVQALTVAVILFGITASVYTIGGFIQLMLEGEIDRALGNQIMTQSISRLDNHVILCGFGRLGKDLAYQLRFRQQPFVVIEKNEAAFDGYEEKVPLHIIGDAQLESVLELAGLHRARTLVACLPTDADNVFVTLTARNMDPDLQIVSKSERESSCLKLKQAGANRIVLPHQAGAQQMERMILRPSTADLIELFAETSEHGLELDECVLRDDISLVGKSIANSGFREDHNLLVIGIKGSQKPIVFNPPANTVLNGGDTLLLMGLNPDLQEFKQRHKL